ncbi:terpenoid synthase [Coniophora puteana RWD-64-598 SS2]|uniref:Terpene synthase n=1 Tax=Coniophora puteana (strain RWD-64-598) TaxID=741705 RepID=A0A5M3MCC4_CONPW|nr:terpenoid synthase [Coniophora puteana RWD-64-598 SS2]EIW76869.1 terpenoid synthase [Coniophora puteana RWD-64-598 SS2]
MLQLPSHFVLQDLCAISGRACELKVSPLQREAGALATKWFDSIGVYDEIKFTKFTKFGKFDLFAALSFPEADLRHLETCLMFFFWAFSTDDLSDEGALQNRPDEVQAGHDVSNAVIDHPEAPRPAYPYAAMLYDLLERFRETGTEGAYARFIRAFEDWSESQVQQSQNRSEDRMPSIHEFILMRRATIGGAMVEAMIEYSLDIDLPDFIFEHPTIIAMSEATNDIMTWPNDLCSFNKEQADGDYQNLVFIIMEERGVGLQEGIDILTDMLSQRVDDYLALKASLPSFGPKVDYELARYLKALEHFTQGTVLWYYLSPRYFRTVDVSNRHNLVVPLFPQSFH